MRETTLEPFIGVCGGNPMEARNKKDRSETGKERKQIQGGLLLAWPQPHSKTQPAQVESVQRGGMKTLCLRTVCWERKEKQWLLPISSPLLVYRILAYLHF